VTLFDGADHEGSTGLDPHVAAGSIVGVVSEDGDRLTVGAVARLVNVSVRMLHHYDQIGLMVPSERTRAGYRSYTAVDVERLHRVLSYRELGFPLEEIATLLDDPHADDIAHLRRQRELIAERVARLQQMAVAIEKMMEAHTMGIQLTAKQQREIFGDNWLGEEYAAEAEQRWGDTDAWRQSQQRTANLTEADWRQVKAEGDALDADLVSAMTSGVAPGSAQANALAERHRASVQRFYDCGDEMHRGLAEMYIADPRFRDRYETIAPGLAQYVHDVIVANADRR
jgi:MerR family transcriptional regulator, thiopeptide resistance regulator